jgi:DNA-binding CsgD family transcriptional regulator
MIQRVFLALIGDVVRSRQSGDRAGLQARLAGAIERLNSLGESDIVSGFVLTVGDEFQGLLASEAGLFGILAQLRAAAYPEELRFGLGIGPLSTPLRQPAIGMDGPCFHRARAAVERAAANQTDVEVEGSAPAPAFTIFASLQAALRSGWTDRQRQVLDLAMTGQSGRSIARQLGISPSAVSQHLRAADHDRLEAAGAAWEAAIHQAMEAAR